MSLSFFLPAAQQAFNRFWAPSAQVFDPLDQVVVAYPPLANEFFVALYFDGVNLPLTSCAESVLILMLMLEWQDKNAALPQDARAPFPGVLTTRCPNGLTMAQMIRRLQHMARVSFPVAMYDVTRDVFELVSGVERNDHWCIVFLPMDLGNGLVQAHWTFGQVKVEAPEPINMAPPWPLVVYTSAPVYGPVCYWRARVTPENMAEFSEAQVQHLACSCDWRVECEHEQDWAQQLPFQVGLPRSVLPLQAVRRVTLEGSVHVQGTLRGVFSRATVGRLARVAQSTMEYRSVRGKVQTFTGMSADIAIKPNARFFQWRHLASSCKYLILRSLGEFDLPQIRIKLFEIPDEDELVRWTVPTLSTFALAALYGGAPMQRVIDLQWDEPKMTWAASADLSLSLPRKDELLNRLALRETLTPESVLDVVRKMSAEERWNVDVDRAEFRFWLTRVVTEVGKTLIPAVSTGQCWTCLRFSRTYRHCCKACKTRLRSHPLLSLPVADETVVYVGFRAIWSKQFRPPPLRLKEDVKVYLRKQGKLLCSGSGEGMPVEKFVDYLQTRAAPVSVRGFLRGPMFLSQEPTCYPRGDAVAVIAFLIRLGAAREHEARDKFYDLCFNFVAPLMQVLSPEDWDVFIAHFSGEKRLKNEEGRQEELEGWLPQPQCGEVHVKMQGFAKAEKSYSSEFKGGVSEGYLQDKPTEKPRFICSPAPVVLAKLGRWTHAQTKWLSKRFSYTERLFYAGCSTPTQLNAWLNITVHDCPAPWTLVDDITAIDANHNPASFRWHRRLRKLQFPHISEWAEGAFTGEECLNVRIGLYKVCVDHVNASGVSDTSYKNSILCIVVRLLAILHGFLDIEQMSDDEVLLRMRQVSQQVWLAASGDDGLVRMPDYVMGVSINDFSIERYQQAWSWAGFSVKVAMVPPTRWRMATFLAMRPVWAATAYEWAPEPARRLRGMFWQIDNTMHPIGWARGVASQVYLQSKALPVLGDIADWYLRRTLGPTISHQVNNVYSPFANSVMSAGKTERSIKEFCMDYRIQHSDYDRFLKILEDVGAPFVSLDCQVLRRVYAEES